MSKMMAFISEREEHIVANRKQRWLPVFSPFATVFFRSLSLLRHQINFNIVLVGKGLTFSQTKSYRPFEINSISGNRSESGTDEFMFSDMVENTLGKGENAGYQLFPPFPKVFSKSLFLRVIKIREWERVFLLFIQFMSIKASMVMSLHCHCDNIGSKISFKMNCSRALFGNYSTKHLTILSENISFLSRNKPAANFITIQTTAVTKCDSKLLPATETSILYTD